MIDSELVRGAARQVEPGDTSAPGWLGWGLLVVVVFLAAIAVSAFLALRSLVASWH